MPDDDTLPADQQEGTEDVDAAIAAIASGVAAIGGSDWTAQTILNQLDRGNIVLNPRFQRRDAWKPVRKSLFIESMILGFPVPQLVLV